MVSFLGKQGVGYLLEAGWRGAGDRGLGSTEKV